MEFAASCLLCLLAAVDDDILWLDPLLQHALFGMLSSASEQARGLNLKVANALFVVVQQAKAELLSDLLVGLFQNLQNNQADHNHASLYACIAAVRLKSCLIVNSNSTVHTNTK